MPGIAKYIQPMNTRRLFYNGSASRINIPTHVIKAADWKVGDTIAFQITPSGGILLTRVPVPDYVATADEARL